MSENIPGQVPGLQLRPTLKSMMTRVVTGIEASRCLWLTPVANVLVCVSAAREGELIEKPCSEPFPQAIVTHVFHHGTQIHDPLPQDLENFPADNRPTRLICLPVNAGDTPVGVLYIEDPVGELGEAYLARLAHLIEQVPEYNQDYNETLTQNRNLREELEQAQKELVRKERLATLGQLIATVSHELRNPLGTVRGSVFIIANRLLGKDLGVERALDRAERNIVRCDRIIEDLLDYTRTHDLELEPVVIDRWLENTLEEYQFPGEISVSFKPECGVELSIEPERLRRCLINLLNNACDAMRPQKGEQVEEGKHLLTLSSACRNGRVEIKVKDTGNGISPQDLEKVMEPLFSTKSFGVGLGLPTVQQILEQHKGGLEMASQPGEGTTVTMWLPVPDPKK